jgi:DNA-binding GntR family transcriptional regulator
LRADVLAKEIGMSRTPIRDALRQLDGDGLVSIKPRVGASVRSIDAGEFSEICGMRLALEIYAAGLAAKLRTDSDLKDIAFACEAVARETERLIAASDPEAHDWERTSSELLVREDIHFHMAIASAAKNGLIRRELVRNQLISRIVSAASLLTSKTYLPANHVEMVSMMRSTISEHRAILDAIQRRDVAAARNVMEIHLTEDVDTLLRRLARDESGMISADLVRPVVPAVAEPRG